MCGEAQLLENEDGELVPVSLKKSEVVVGVGIFLILALVAFLALVRYNASVEANKPQPVPAVMVEQDTN